MDSGIGDCQSRWWHQPDRVTGFVHGVFEGGGAKGALYVGALEGVLKNKLWFSAVSGSSAGAITAAMIASGMEPSEMRSTMEEGLGAMALPKKRRGLRRLYQGTGLLDHGAVLEWLRGVLLAQCEKEGVHPEGKGPTFDELFRMTCIDLFVAAVDLRARQLVLFNHRKTGRSEVAEAVMASATIPVAFEPLLFGIGNKGPHGEWVLEHARFVADGGIASNFPAFVFNDEAFRGYAGLGPRNRETPILGFILDEDSRPREDVRELYERGRFLGHYHGVMRELRAFIEEEREQRKGERPADGNETEPRTRRTQEPPRIPDAVELCPEEVHRSRPARVLRAGLGAADMGFVKLLYILGWSMGGERAAWNWPDPRNRHARAWVATFRRWLESSAIPLILAPVAYTAMFAFGFLTILRWALPDFGDTSLAGIVIGLIITVGVLVLAIWVWLLGLVAFALLRISYRTVGLLGHQLLTTFFNTPAAPPWAGHGPNEYLIRLPVPPRVSTLRVALCPDETLTRVLADLLADAEATASSRVRGVTGSQWTQAGV